MREFGPNRFQRLEQSKEDRNLLLAGFRAANLHPTLPEPIRIDEFRKRETLYNPRHLRGKFVQSSLMAGLALLGAACGTAPSSSAKEVNNSPSTSSEPKIIYLLQGPHDTYLKGGIKDAVDLGPPVVIPCSPGERKVLDDPSVIASASGTVVAVGKDDDRNDPLHSVVVVKMINGNFAGDMHLAETKVKVGDQVTAGVTELGKYSCEVVPGGETIGMHDHHFRRGPSGEQIPIDGQEIFGFTVHADNSPHQPNTPYKGTMTKPGEETRVSNPGRCGPDPVTIKACGGIRNDISFGTQAQTANPKEGASPIPPVPVITPNIAAPNLAPSTNEAPKPVGQAPRIGYTRHSSTTSPYRVDRLSDWKVSSGSTSQRSADVFFGNIQNPIPEFSVVTVPVKSFVTSESFAQECQAIADRRQAFDFKGTKFEKIQPPTLTEHLISGKKAYEVKYLSNVVGNKNNPVLVTDLCFVDGGLSWDISFMQYYVVDATKFKQDSDIYDHMASSFKLNSSK